MTWPRRGLALSAAVAGAALAAGPLDAQPAPAPPNPVPVDVSGAPDPARAIADALVDGLAPPPSAARFAVLVRARLGGDGPADSAGEGTLAASLGDAIAAAIVARWQGEPPPAGARRPPAGAATPAPGGSSEVEVATLPASDPRGPRAVAAGVDARRILVVDVRRVGDRLEVAGHHFARALSAAARLARVAPALVALAPLGLPVLLLPPTSSLPAAPEEVAGARLVVPVSAPLARWPGAAPTRPRAGADTLLARATALPAGPRILALHVRHGRVIVAREDGLSGAALERDLRGRPVWRETRWPWFSRRPGTAPPSVEAAHLDLEALAAAPDVSPWPRPRARWPTADFATNAAGDLVLRIAGLGALEVPGPGDARDSEVSPVGAVEPVPPAGHPDAGCAPDRSAIDLSCAPAVPGRGHLVARPWPGPFLAAAVRDLADVNGEVIRYEVATTVSGVLAARTGRGSSAAVGHGMALGVADLDADGTLEILTGEARDPGTGDRLHVIRLGPDGELVHVWASARLPGSVYVAAGGDADGDGREELLAVEAPAAPGGAGRLWVVR